MHLGYNYVHTATETVFISYMILVVAIKDILQNGGTKFGSNDVQHSRGTVL